VNHQGLVSHPRTAHRSTARSDSKRRFPNRRTPMQLANAKQTEKISSFSKGFSFFLKPNYNFSEKPFKIVANYNPFPEDWKSNDRIEFRNKGTKFNYRRKIFGSVDEFGNLKESHKINFPHFVRIWNKKEVCRK
jgi:hypothetical protein